MSIRFASSEEIAHWNELILSNPDSGNILQSAEMAETKKFGGWKPRYIIADDVAFVALERTLPILGKFWYIIKGPGIIAVSELEAFLVELKRFAGENGVFVVKIEPEILKTNEAIVDLMKLGLLKVRNIQANASTVYLDISSDLDTVLMGLNQKTRHAIRRAERDGVIITQVTASDENCEKMFELYKITAEGKFGTRPYEYYKQFWQRFENAGLGQLFFAHVDGQFVAAAYGLVFGNKSTYKDGASVRERPAYGVSHLLQWRLIQWGKSKGATIHDLCGAPPSDQINDSNHAYYGFGRFKTSFNKEVTDFIGTYDIAVRPYRYTIWVKFGERVALRWHLWRNHETFY